MLLARHFMPHLISHLLCGRQLSHQQLKDGIKSIAVILGLSSVSIHLFVIILLLFYVQKKCGHVRVALEGYVGRAIISVGIEK